MAENGIAIVGIACIFPGAPDLQTFWRNISQGYDAIDEIPAHRLDPVFFDSSLKTGDRFYCRRGGTIDEYLGFDPAPYRMMPNTARSAEPDQLLTLKLCREALWDAGYVDSVHESIRNRTGVILGKGNYLGSAGRRFDAYIRDAEQLIISLRELVPDIREADLLRIKREFQRKAKATNLDGVIGLVPNLTASRVAHALDLKGAAYTVDGACASALLAVDQACQQLVTEEADLMLCGGIHVCQDEAFWGVFSQLGALSRRQMIRPFDKMADGLLIGEGVGVLVLKREKDALRDHDRVYAVIRGTGISSDGQGASLMSPNIDGQVLALERAWQHARRDCNEIGLLEAHGTATPVGDAAEAETLRRFFGEPSSNRRRAGIGSIKSMIGHAMPAAGAAGLIKTALALFHRVFPPTLHCEDPLPALEQTLFRPIHKASPWTEKCRLAGVNAFGFGGINAHVVLESVDDSSIIKVSSRVATETIKETTRSPKQMVPLSLSMPLVRFDREFTRTITAPVSGREPRLGLQDENEPVISAFTQSMRQIARAQAEVIDYGEKSSNEKPLRSGTSTRGKITVIQRISLERYPELIDHTFHRQPLDWLNASDRQPIVPMTALIDLMVELAQRVVPERRVVAVENVQALQWLSIANPVEARFSYMFQGADRFSVEIEGYAKGTVILADDYPRPPVEASIPLKNEKPASVSADNLYRDRHLFHGPAYRGIKSFGPVADNGVCGVLESGAAKGALLDNAGQLLGVWIQLNTERDRLAMPIGLQRVTFYGPHPEPGTRLRSVVRIQNMDERLIVANISIKQGEKLWADIQGWQDRRFPTDDLLWDMIFWPDKSLMSKRSESGVYVFYDQYHTAFARGYLEGQYLREIERRQVNTLSPRLKRQWLNGRVVAKDAIRDYLWQRGHGPIYPAEVMISDDPNGRLMIEEPTGNDLQVSIAHQDDYAVAVVGKGQRVGIDIKAIKAGDPEILKSAFQGDAIHFVDRAKRDQTIAGISAVKQAFINAQDSAVQTEDSEVAILEQQGNKYRIGNRWFSTVHYKGYVIAYTYPAYSYTEQESTESG
ncbi:MAG: polyketide synthase dehydratase domain-containing protein [Deltaproteobacteria bacterium]|nr:polyketide synthase dehydratase domain-containing protein [Deltaproteobacteria bacterium]